jgi:predicted O-methyltransferase YrrM
VIGLACGLGVLAALIFALLWREYRLRLYHELGRDTGGPIPTLALSDLDAVFATTPLGPTPGAEVHFIGTGGGVPGGTTDREAWILAALAKSRRTFFEFGTATGRTAYLLARNSPDDARVHTLTLSPDALGAYTDDPDDSRRARQIALRESRFTTFLYTGTPVEEKVTQLFGDSKELDIEPYRGRCDLVFVDGSHTYSYVMNDSAKAMEMVAPGGLILWHDYRPGRRADRDVARALAELSRTHALVRLRRTSLVAYRAPA